MQFLHSMIRVLDVERSLAFYCDLLGLQLIRRKDHAKGRFSLLFLSSGQVGDSAQIELTYNWDQTQPYSSGENFGHLAFAVADIYVLCDKLQQAGVPILRPPKDGRMAFVKCPDGISIELLQIGEPLEPKEPWLTQANCGQW